MSTQATESLVSLASKTQRKPTTSKATLLGGLLAGIGASACCVGPFLLVSLGISGSWIGNLSAMGAYRPYLAVVTLIFMGLAFRKLYIVPQQCDIDSPCADPKYVRNQRRYFWIISVFILAIFTFPYYAEYFFD